MSDKQEIKGKTITQSFLQLFDNKWYKYGHWSMFMVLAFWNYLVFSITLNIQWEYSIIFAGIISWLEMLGLEVTQHIKKGDTGFNKKDIWQNTRGLITLLVIFVILLLIEVWKRIS